MFVDYLLLLCVKRIIHSNTKYKRILLGSLCGAVISFTAFIPFNHFPLNIVINISESFLITLISFGYKNKQRYLKTTSLLIIVSFLFSGAMIFFYNALHPESMVIINNSVYFNINPVILIILSLVIYIIIYIFKKFFKNHSASNLIHNLKLVLAENEYRIKCKIDSGCVVKEPFSGNRVVIVEKNEIIKPDKLKMRIIPFNSLGGKGILEGYKADKVFIDEKPINEEIYIGLCEGIFKTEIKGLIPEGLIED